MDRLSYTVLTKKELVSRKLGKREQLLAEASAFAFSAGSIRLMHGGAALEMTSETRDVTVRMAAILAKLYGGEPEMLSVEKNQPKKHTVYALDISPLSPQGQFLFDIGLFTGSRDDFSFGTVNGKVFEPAGTFEAALRGAFLACGVLCDPQKGYRLEFVLSNTEFAEFLLGKMNELQIEAKLFERNERTVLYIKKIESISQVLILIGASSVMMQLENIRVFKDVKNNLNRTDNCLIGNMGKTIDASGRQTDDIMFLLDKKVKLSASLEEACRLRLDNPEASLSELAEISGNTTKSALNKRFIKIHELREQYDKL